MGVRQEHASEEVTRLQRCLNDLVSVLALPAMWSGFQPSEIVHTSLDALLGMLCLDLVYGRCRSGGRRANRGTEDRSVGEVDSARRDSQDVKPTVRRRSSEVAVAITRLDRRRRHLDRVPAMRAAR